MAQGQDERHWKLSPKHWKALIFAKYAKGMISEEVLDVELDWSQSGDAPELVTTSTLVL